MQKYLQIK